MIKNKRTFQDNNIDLSHGAGGKASRRLIDELIAPTLKIDQLTDAANVPFSTEQIAFTTDSYVVHPLTFSGGSIGELAINGTVNDLAMSGAKPQAIVTTFIIEAGLKTSVLEEQLYQLHQAAEKANIKIVGGDTKVVENQKADQLFITTAGIGAVDKRIQLDAKRVEVGDKIILSGPIGDHGITILLARGELDLESNISSDTRSVWPFVSRLIDVASPGLKWMRDPTRGGVATVLNELCHDANVAIELIEENIPIRPEVRGACEILGLEPLHIANEGQFIAVVAPEYETIVLEELADVPGGDEAVCIGEIKQLDNNIVLSRSSYGGTRVIDMLVGDPLPRIC